MEKLRPGDPPRIGGYRLLARLGVGGMGQVYLARSDRGRTVAVKLVRRELAEQEVFRARFRQEVQAASRVGGYWTAPVLDADTEAAVPWVATGYVAGPSLQRVVGQDHGALPERSVRVLAAGLAQALGDIHAAGIVHRDLKPSNVLVTIDGPRVIDFGIARALETPTENGLTRTGSLVGSPGFMAPEQVRGDRVTPACDVFCLGSLLVYAATGALPFGPADSGVHAQMFRIAQEEPDLTGVPEGIADLVHACLRKDPAARPSLATILERTGAQDTVAGGRSRDPWLPAVLVAQLGRHAMRLLETENPTETAQPGTGEARDGDGGDGGGGAGTARRGDGGGTGRGSDGGGDGRAGNGRAGNGRAGDGGGNGQADQEGSRNPGSPEGRGGPGGQGSPEVPEGASPAQGPGEGADPAQRTGPAPGQGPLRGQGPVSGRGLAPGEGPVSGQGPLRGRGAVSGQGPVPGEGPVSGQGPVSGRSPAFGEGPFPGQSHAPGQGPVLGHTPAPEATFGHKPAPQATPGRTPDVEASPGHTPEAVPEHASAADDGSSVDAGSGGPAGPAPVRRADTAAPAPVHGHPQHPHPVQHPAYGRSQHGAPGPHGSYHPYGDPGPTPSYGPPPVGATVFHQPGGPQEEQPRDGRSTALLVVIALVVALAAGASVFALMSGGGRPAGGPSAAPTAAASAHPTAPGPSGSRPASSGPASEPPADGAVPEAYLGTWAATIDGAAGPNTRRLTIRQGRVGEAVLTLVAEGPAGQGTYHCEFTARLTRKPGADGPLEIGPSTVTSGEPRASCSPGAATEVTLLPSGGLERVNTSTGESLTYVRG
ncbi:protein kinase domain-containing protein [Streptomyces adustus]